MNNIGKAYERKQDIHAYLVEQETVIRELVRVLNTNGSICWQTGNYVDDGEVFPLDIYFYPMFKKYGLKLRNRIIWRFEHGLHASKRFSGRYETILWFTKSDSYTFNLDPVRVPSKYPGKLHFKGPRKGQPSGNPLGKILLIYGRFWRKNGKDVSGIFLRLRQTISRKHPIPANSLSNSSNVVCWH